jgi:hypothetical protein
MSAVVVVRVQEDEAVEDRVGKEAKRGHANHGGRIGTPEAQGFRQEIEERRRQYRAGAEAQNKMKPVAQAKRESAPGQSGATGAKRQK